MARMARSEVFNPEEIATVHVSNRCVRGLHFLGKDKLTGKDFSHRREWFRCEMLRCAMHFAIDLLEHAIMSNHFHMLLRSRPDIVKCWNNTEVARRWLKLCPKRKHKDGTPKEPTTAEIRSLTKDPDILKALRRRLSDISWFVRKVCQPVAQRANREMECTGKFWDTRFNAVRLLDEEAVLACSLYINLNPVRAMLAYEVEKSHYTSAQQRIEDLQAMIQVAEAMGSEIEDRRAALDDRLPSDPEIEHLEVCGQLSHVSVPAVHSLFPEQPVDEGVTPPANVRKLADVLTERLDEVRAELAWEPEEGDEETPEMLELSKLPREPYRPAGYLAPLEIDEARDPLGPRLSRSPQRCSDRGYLPMPLAKYIELLEWCARQIRPDKPGFTPSETPPIIQRLGIPEDVWIKLVNNFGELFSIVAGMPESIDAHRGSRRQHYHMPQATRELLTLHPVSTSAQPETRVDCVDRVAGP